MQSWRLSELETPGGSRSPVVLNSKAAGRAVLIGLEPGQELGDHQVKEHAWVLVVEGRARIECRGEVVDGGPGLLASFEPDEVHSVSSESGARILLFLSPWPGEGHYRGEQPAAPAGSS
jgi:quercetin dioxygenase-like cupin family protein